MKICHATINRIDLERRIKNQAGSGKQAGFSISIVALGKPGETKNTEYSDFQLIRLRTRFHRGGPAKFIIYNFKLLFFFLTHSFNIIHCHDLWVLPACAVATVMKRSKLVYDAHEYYAGLEIFNMSPVRRAVWLFFERILIYRADILLTVSEPLGAKFKERYPRLSRVEIIRNLPAYEKYGAEHNSRQADAGNPLTLVYQGHFKPGRGLENLVKAIGLLRDVKLILIGGGELEDRLKKLVAAASLRDRIEFKGYVDTDKLIEHTSKADIGVVLFEPTSMNYAYALPNKFFEYIMAGVPVLASNIETFRTYIAKYKFGITTDPEDPRKIKQSIEKMCRDKKALHDWRENARAAALELNWEKESGRLVRIYDDLSE